MTIRLRTLASGSSGNAVFLRINDTCLLIDVGIPYSRICAGLESMGESVDDLVALVITHEHTDHIKGLDTLLKHHPDLDIYTTAGTSSGLKSDEWTDNIQTIKAGRTFSINDLEIHPFRTSHDAKEPVGFRFEVPGFALGLATDLGQVTRDVLQALKDCNILILEANYDALMLQWSPYPAFLKRRISGRGGHLSNAQSAELLRRVQSPLLESVILVHLSEKNNGPEQAVTAVRASLGTRKDVPVIAAPRHEPGPALSFQIREVQGQVKEEKQQILPF